MILAELNYNIYNKKLLRIVIVLKEQRAFLYNTIELFRVITDHKNLIRFFTIKELNQRQVRWAEELIKYIKETESIKIDMLNKTIEF